MFFLPYYEYGSHNYEYDAKRFVFRTHKKFEKALKIISTDNEEFYERFGELTNGKAKDHNELIALLDDADLIKPVQRDGANVWNQFIYSFLRIEQLSIEIIDVFSAKIDQQKAEGKAPQEARHSVSINLISQEARDEYQTLSLSLMSLPKQLYFPTNQGFSDNDLRGVFKEIASEAFKAPVSKGRETMFLLNRSLKIAGVLECIKSLEEKALEAFPNIEKEIHNFFMSARRLVTIRRRENDIRQEAKEEYYQARQEFYEAFKTLPRGYQKSSLAHVTDSKHALGATMQLRYPLPDSINRLAQEMQGFCKLE